MKLLEKPQTVLTHEGVYLSLKLSKNDVQGVQSLVEGLGEIDPTKEYDITIKRHRQKRSLDANAFFWILAGKLAEKLGSTSEEVYRHYIHLYGIYEIIPIKDEAVEKWIQIWKSHGVGWICEDLGACRNTPGYRNIKTYYGSSTYDTKQMSRLIDGIVEDCKEFGIETLPPDEIEHLKEMWK